MLMRPAAKKMPQRSRIKAEMNCSGANGSEAFFSSFFGLHVPVSQKRRRRSRSPIEKEEKKEKMAMKLLVMGKKESGQSRCFVLLSRQRMGQTTKCILFPLFLRAKSRSFIPV